MNQAPRWGERSSRDAQMTTRSFPGPVSTSMSVRARWVLGVLWAHAFASLPSSAWAESMPPPDGGNDFPALMDAELDAGREDVSEPAPPPPRDAMPADATPDAQGEAP